MKHFTVEELTRSYTAAHNGISNIPNRQSLDNLIALVENTLDPVRELAGAPIYVNSGYRSVMLNRAVGGVPHSQHTKGEAADITTGDREANVRLAVMIAGSDIPYDQLIVEKCGEWLHISFTSARPNRRQTIYSGK